MEDASAMFAEIGTEVEEIDPEDTERRAPVIGAYLGIDDELLMEEVTSATAILAVTFELEKLGEGVLVALAREEEVVFKLEEDVAKLTSPSLAEAAPHITAGV